MATRWRSPPESALRARSRSGSEQIERLLHAHAHFLRRHGGVFEGEGDLVLHAIHDELRFGVLEDKAHVAAEHLGGGGHGVERADAHVARQLAAAKVGNQPIDAAQQRRLARTGRADHQDQLAFRQLQADILERRCVRAGVGVG
jgi:hypothetical protein